MHRKQLSRAVPLELSGLGGDISSPVYAVPQCRKGMPAVLDSASPIASFPAQLGASGKRVRHLNCAGTAKQLIERDGAIKRGFSFVKAPHSREQTAEPNQRVSEIRGVIGACLGDQTLTGAKLLNSLDPPLFGLGDQPKQHMSESFEPPIRRRRCPKHSKSCVCAAFCRDDV